MEAYRREEEVEALGVVLASEGGSDEHINKAERVESSILPLPDSLSFLFD